jgi:hypothetical protein
MRAIVALLKYFVGAAFLLSTVGLALLLGASIAGLDGTPFNTTFGGLGIFVAILAFVVLVLYTGLIALLISGHDRLGEIADLMRERNER